MNQLLTDYIARKLIEDVRSGARLSEELCEKLNRYALVDTLRMVVEPTDIDKLMELAESPSSMMGNLALSLLRRFDTEERVKQFLRKAWDDTDSYSRKFHLMWRLLDDPDIDDAAREEVHSFVMAKFEPFLADVAAWTGGEEELLDRCRSRLADETFPPSKAWIYLICVTGSPDTQSAKELLREHLSSEDAFTAQVARDMLERISA